MPQTEIAFDPGQANARKVGFIQFQAYFFILSAFRERLLCKLETFTGQHARV